MRIARVIARLNVGGPARHVLAAARGLAPEWETALLAGDVGPDEAEATDWIESSGVVPERVPGLGRAVRPFDDVRALRFLVRRFRELRPHVVHTHTAKAGALGRIAATALPRGERPFVVHTFHGHVFDGYFGRFATAAIVAAERRLARRTDRIVAVSDEVARDLVERFRIAPAAKVVVIPPGIDAAPFAAASATPERRAAARAALGIEADAQVVVWAGRLVPVKDPALAIDVAGRVAATVPGAVLLVAGDGPLRADLDRAAPASVRFLGNVSDMPGLVAAADLALLTSRNEGTPVALIEAAAAGVAAVATRVGGVETVVADGVTGCLVPSGAAASVADAVVALLRDPARRTAMGEAAAARAAARFSTGRMLSDLRTLYAAAGVRSPR